MNITMEHGAIQYLCPHRLAFSTAHMIDDARGALDLNHMALSEIEVARVKKGLDSFMRLRRPPPHIRAQLDLGYRISGQSVENLRNPPGLARPTR